MENLSPWLSRSYNDLLGVADASHALDDLGGEETVGKILSIIKDAGLSSCIGIRLLHKHNDISEAEVMLEAAVTDDEGFALMTSAVPAGNAAGAVSNSWRFTDEGYVPCEFSNSELLVEPKFSIDEHRTTFNHVAEALRDYRAERILGPSINYSEYVKAARPHDNAKFLEKTDVENRANVLRYISLEDPVFRGSVKTKWCIDQTPGVGGEFIWMASCSCFCSVFPQGGHQGTKTHRYNP